MSPILQQTLNRYGLGSLLTWATQAIVQGWSDDQILLELYERPEFNARFPAIKAREAAGFPPLNPEDYLAFEDMVYGMSTMWGMKITQQQIDTMLSKNVSAREAEERINLAVAAVYEDDSETRQEIMRMYDVGIGDLANYWMDPKTTMGVLQQQYRTAQIAGASLRSGYGQLTEVQARRLLSSGMNRESALTGFSELVAAEDLFKSYLDTEEDIDQDTQVELLAGNADVAKSMENRAKRRLAEYQAGGGFAAGQTGFGVGSASG